MQLHRCGAQRRSAGGMHLQLPGIYRKRAARIELPGESLRAAAAFDEMQRPQHRAMKMMFPCCINTQRVGSRLQVRGKAGGVAQRPGALLQPPAVQISRGADVLRGIQPADAATAAHPQGADEIRTLRLTVPRHIQHHAAAQAGRVKLQHSGCIAETVLIPDSAVMTEREIAREPRQRSAAAQTEDIERAGRNGAERQIPAARDLADGHPARICRIMPLVPEHQACLLIPRLQPPDADVVPRLSPTARQHQHHLLTRKLQHLMHHLLPRQPQPGTEYQK